ncbi:MAG: DUF4375 domain-containing protein [Exilibacterium sp.]
MKFANLNAFWQQYALEAEVNNGGFDQLFYNSAGDIAFYTAKALDSIGAHNGRLPTPHRLLLSATLHSRASQ